LELDYRQEPVAVADVFLLTSDGVHEWLSDRDLAMLLAEQLAQGVDLEAAAYALVQAAERAGADDNLTALLVRVDELPIADLDEVHRNLTALAIPPVLEPGQKLDHYEVQKVLHAGTRSHIYRVRDLHSHQSLVLKAPSENFADDAQYLEGFIREQWVGRRISHPGVMKILARPEDSRFLYHLCEYIDGITLRQWLYDHPKPDLKTVRELTAQLVGGLRAFQRLSMVHRDLKPENVIIDPQGRLVIVDFGTVYVAGLGEICSPLSEEVPVGSVDYIAPEYVLGEPCTECSDFFSLAVMVYELLCGQLPFDLPDLQRKPPKNYDAWRYISVRSRRADLPLWLDLALQKALSARPSQRQAAFSEFLQDLEKPNAQLLANHQQVPLIERNPLVFWRSVSLLLLLVIIVQWLWMAH
jgi:protein phosphatase